MISSRSKWLIFSLSLGVLVLAVLGMRKTVTFVVDGQSRSIVTFAPTVKHVLLEQNVSFSPADRLQPALEEWLWRDETVILERAAAVLVRDGDQEYHLLSTERTPNEVLDQAGVTLSPGDELYAEGRLIDPDRSMEYAGSHVLSIRRAAPVRIHEAGGATTIESTAPDLGQALWEQGIVLRAADQVEPSLETALPESGLDVHIRRSQEYLVEIGEEDIEVRSAAASVGEVLAESSIALQGLDYSIPPEAAPAPEDGLIRVVRVSEEVIIEQEPLPFETEYQAVSDLEIDQQQIVQTGEYGLSARRVRVVYEDGLEVSRQVEEEWIARQPKNRIAGYGTMIVMRTLDTPDGPIQYWRALQMYATSYHPATTSNTTASGLPLKKGVAAIDRRYIPFYTKMYVPGYGEALAADVGGGVRGRWIDLGYSDDDFVNWHEWVTVYFLWPPPDNVVWIIP